MAQLRDLIVNGASRFLGVVNFNNETIFNEGVALNETLTLLKNTDATGDSYTAPALVIGPYTEQHLEFDTNEIMSKSAAGTPAALHLNYDGGQVIIGKDGLKVGNGKAATADDPGVLQVSGGLSTTATSFFGAGVTINSTLSVTGNTTIGDATSDVHKITGNTTHNGIVYFANGTTYYVNNSGSAKFNTLTSVGNTTLGDSSTGDTIAINGVTTITGNTKVVGTLTAQGNIVPSANNTYNLGSSGNKWKELYVNSVAYIGNGADASSTTTGVARVNGGLGVTKSGYFGGSINLSRKSDIASGRISFYDPSFYTWFNYMSNPAAGTAPTRGQPSTYGDVTSWALRSLIENTSGYGWIWESAVNAEANNTTTPTPIMALSSSAGNLRIKGDFFAEGGDVTLGSAGTYYINTGTSKLNALTLNTLTTAGLITAGSHIIPNVNDANLGSISNKWQNLYVKNIIVGNGASASAVNTGNIQITGGLSASENSYFDEQVIIKKAVVEYDATDECLYFSFNI